METDRQQRMIWMTAIAPKDTYVDSTEETFGYILYPLLHTKKKLDAATYTCTAMRGGKEPCESYIFFTREGGIKIKVMMVC